MLVAAVTTWKKRKTTMIMQIATTQVELGTQIQPCLALVGGDAP
jgi:hypothetical protein